MIVGANAWTNWTSYECEADFLTPADSWTVEAANPTVAQLASLIPGTVVQVLVDKVPALKGWLERKQIRRTRTGGLLVTLSGRDYAGPLVDCMPPATWSFTSTPLQAVAQAALTELGVASTVDASAEAAQPRARIKAEPGETYWQVLVRYAKKLRLMVWMTPAGVLRIGRPSYTSAPLATLVNGATDATRATTNVLESIYSNDIAGRYSQVTVVGQAAGGGGLWSSAAQATVTGVATDPELSALGLVRPITIDDGDVRSYGEAIDRAKWEISRKKFAGEQLQYVVPGHGPTRGQVWAPDQQVTVQDDLAGVVGVWWIAGRRLTKDRERGTRTTLELRPPNTLLPAV